MRYAFFIALMASTLAKAQNRSQVFADRFNAYYTQYPPTRVQLILNQEKYTPGDTIFFKIYFLNEDLLRVAGKELIEIDLVNEEGSIQHARAMVEDGIGYNQLVIPQDIQPGYFFITAYSNWIRNFGVDAFFRKPIEVVKEKRLISPITARAEGGNLVVGIKTRMAISGKPLARAEIWDTQQHCIATTQLDDQGLGDAWITPQHGVDYVLKVDETSVSLPTEESGVTLRVVQQEGEANVKLIARASPDLANQSHYVLITGQGKAYFAVQFRQGDQDSVVVTLPTENMGQGVVHASVLNQAGERVANRDFYHKGDRTIDVQIETARGTYPTRASVDVTVLLQDQNGKSLAGDFSVSVWNAAVLDDMYTITNDHALIDLACRYATTNGLYTRNLDRHLILYPRPVDWNLILKGSEKKPAYDFRNTIQRTGTARLKSTGEPLPVASVLMFYLQRQLKVFQTVTLEDGRFGVSMLDVAGVDELFYMAQTARGKLLPEIEISWDEEEIPLPRPAASTESEEPDLYGRFAQNKKLIEKSYHAYSQVADTSATGTPIDHLDLTSIGGADIVVNLKDYVAFPSMADLLKEIVPSVLHRNRNDHPMVRIRLDPPNAYSPLVVATADPVYIIDGIATRNTNFFLSLVPSDIRVIKVLKNPSKLSGFGLMGKNGLIIVETRLGSVRERLNPENLLVGISRPIAFKQTSALGAAPVFRSNLHWIPSVRTDGKSSFSFVLTDDVGEMVILIRGLTDDGIPFWGYQKIQVTNPAP